MIEPHLSDAARRYIRLMLGVIRPSAARLDREFRKRLRAQGYDPLQVGAMVAITASAAARLTSLTQFLEQVRYNGRRLALLNLTPSSADKALAEFATLLDPLLAGSFAPAREQLQLATAFATQGAFSDVRELEAQAFHEICVAEIGARGIEMLVARHVRILKRVLHAQAGELILSDAPPSGRLARPIFVRQGKRDEALVDPSMRGQYLSYWSFPVAQIGVIQFGFSKEYPWLPREAELVNTAASRCAEAIERVRMESRLRRLEIDSRRVEDRERNRIGRELHDEAGQLLLTARLQLELVERDAPAPLRPRLREIRRATERTIVEMRRIVAALSPAVLDRLGLEAALRRLAERTSASHKARVGLRIQGDGNAIPEPARDVVYRVAQEALQNAVKHSEAKAIKVSLRAADQWVKLSVVDDGRGFNAEMAETKPMSFGLAGMRERAALLGGILSIESAPGRGAKVQLQLPLSSAPVVSHG
jgi:signal transduction histidine kinase